MDGWLALSIRMERDTILALARVGLTPEMIADRTRRMGLPTRSATAVKSLLKIYAFRARNENT